MPVYKDNAHNRYGLPRPLPRSRVPQYFGSPCRASNFVAITVPIIGKMYVHKRIAPGFQHVFEDILAAQKDGLIDLGDYGGTYNCRQVRRGSARSPHSWAIAVDLNVHHLATSSGTERRLAASNYLCREEQIAPSLRQLAPFFWRWGFAWGGVWTTGLDPMHYEATELTIALLENTDHPDMEVWHTRMQQLGVFEAPIVPSHELPGVYFEDARLGDFVNLDGVGYMPARALEELGFVVEWSAGRINLKLSPDREGSTEES